MLFKPDTWVRRTDAFTSTVHGSKWEGGVVCFEKNTCSKHSTRDRAQFISSAPHFNLVEATWMDLNDASCDVASILETNYISEAVKTDNSNPITAHLSEVFTKELVNDVFKELRTTGLTDDLLLVYSSLIFDAS